MELFFFIFSKKYIFFTFLPVHSSFKKNEIMKKKNPDLPTGSFFPTRPTGNDFLLKGGLVNLNKLHIKPTPTLQICTKSAVKISCCKGRTTF